MSTIKSQALQDLEWAVGLNRLSLQIIGTNTGTDGRTGWRGIVTKLRLLMFFMSIFFLSFIPQTTALTRVWGHLKLVTDNMIELLLISVTEFQLIVLWHKNEAIATMMEYIKNDWMQPKTRQERDVMLKYGKLSRTITIGGYLTISVAVICYHTPLMFGIVLRTLTNLTDIGDRPFVLQTSYFFDAYQSPIYELIVISQFLVAAFCGFCYNTMGTLFGVIVLHVSAQLENLYNRIEETGKNGDTDNFQIEIKFNVEEHERLIRFSEMIENTFSMMLLGVVLCFTLMVCLHGYQIIVILTDDIQQPLIQVVFSITYIMYVIFITFLYSAVGDTLVSQSEKIQYATYNCEWYKLKSRKAAQIIPILIRSQRPLVITAGKFASITLPTFATLLKTTVGYISCLLAIKD